MIRMEKTGGTGKPGTQVKAKAKEKTKEKEKEKAHAPPSSPKPASASLQGGIASPHKAMEEGGATQSQNGSAAIEEKQPEPQPEPQPKPQPDNGGSNAAAADTSEPRAQAATMVKSIANLSEFQLQLSSVPGKLVVVDFSATWCGPCKMIKPFFHSLGEKYPDVIFLEIDVDDAQDVAAHCDVKCMPTFQFYKNNEKVHEFSGANKEKLEETIKKFM